MRHTNEKHRLLPGFGRSVLDGASWMLLEHIVNVLQACEFAFANGVDAFIHPADGGPERDAVVTNFAEIGRASCRERARTRGVVRARARPSKARRQTVS